MLATRCVVCVSGDRGSNSGRRDGSRLRAATGQIDLIRDYEWGTKMSPEGIAQGFTHCFLLTFASAADRDAYLVHPAHQAFVASLQPVLEKALVIDYWVHGY